MTITTKILGYPGNDNALFCKLNTGQHVYHFLMDCGQVGLHQLGKGTIQEIDHLFISHGHMDHISGFDSLFRHIYGKTGPFHIWGPTGITHLMHCRFQGYTWNLVKRNPGHMAVHEVSSDDIVSTEFFCREGFTKKHPLSKKTFEGCLIDHPDFTVHTAILDHRIDCLAFSLLEKERTNISPQKLKQLGLSPGKWCAALKDPTRSPDETLEINGKHYSLKELKKRLLETTPGHKITYVTDIIMTPPNREKLLHLAHASDELIIECTYKDEDETLATQNYHLTVSQSAALAHDAHVKKLTLFHVSDRYQKQDRQDLLAQAKKIHPHTSFPSHWNK